MRLICLNIFGGRVHEPLLEFLRIEAPRTNIFCLQEVWSNTLEGTDGLAAELRNIFTEFEFHFAPLNEKRDFLDYRDVFVGQAILIKNNLIVGDHGQTLVHLGEDRAEPFGGPRNLQYLRLTDAVGHIFSLFNLHGIAHWPKTDNLYRLGQSQATLDLVAKFSYPKILCGDFNLKPDTESVAMLKKGMRSLTDDYGIKTTRGRYKEFEDRISDYMIVSPEIKVLDFKVPDIVISDHLPLILDFEL